MIKVIIELEGGLVQAVVASEKIEYIVVDYDSEGLIEELDQKNGFHMSAPEKSSATNDFTEFYEEIDNSISEKNKEVVRQLMEYGFIEHPSQKFEALIKAAGLNSPAVYYDKIRSQWESGNKALGETMFSNMPKQFQRVYIEQWASGYEAYYYLAK